MTRREASKVDTSFYDDFDEDSGLYCVFGDISGFAYCSFGNPREAADKSVEMHNALKQS